MPGTPWHLRQDIAHNRGVSGLLGIAAAGGAVGLTVAAAPGPVGLLVAGSGRHGWRAGTGAAAGVATADLLWAAVAASTGAALATSPLVGPAQLVARALLVAVGAGLLVRSVRVLRRDRGPVAGGVPPAPRSAPPHPARLYAVTLGLTLPNPLTVGVFTAAALEAGVLAGGSAGTVLVFALAAGLASLAWQLLLAGAGHRLLAGRGPRTVAALTGASGLVLVGWALL